MHLVSTSQNCVSTLISLSLSLSLSLSFSSHLIHQPLLSSVLLFSVFWWNLCRWLILFHKCLIDFTSDPEISLWMFLIYNVFKRRLGFLFYLF
jgi:hypothetical protein